MIRKVTLVSYINTLPYLEALKKGGNFQLDLRIPSQCAAAFEDYSSDIALVPIGSLCDITRPYKRIDKFGIGGDGEVKTVKLLSKCKKENIKRVFLDSQSSTSVQLIKIMAKQYWKLSLEFDRFNVGDIFPDSVLAIGDKVFEMESEYEYAYDMSAEWKKYTGLPFAFAIWITRTDLSTQEEDDLIQVLSQVPSLLNSVVHMYAPDFPNYDLESYLKQSIQYELHSDYSKAIDLFLKYQNSLIQNV